jgi:hypothetical protein
MSEEKLSPTQENFEQRRIERQASHHHPNSNALIANGRGEVVRNDTLQRVAGKAVVKKAFMLAGAVVLSALASTSSHACGVPLGGLIGAIANASQDCTAEFNQNAADFCLLKGFKPGTQYYAACFV